MENSTFCDNSSMLISNQYSNKIIPELLFDPFVEDKKFNIATIVSKSLFYELSFESNLFQLSENNYLEYLSLLDIDFVLVEFSAFESTSSLPFYWDIRSPSFSIFKKILTYSKSVNLPTILYIENLSSSFFLGLLEIINQFDFVFCSDLRNNEDLLKIKQIEKINPFIQTKIFNPFLVNKLNGYEYIFDNVKSFLPIEKLSQFKLLSESNFKGYNYTVKSETNADCEIGCLSFLQYLYLIKSSVVSYHFNELISQSCKFINGIIEAIATYNYPCTISDNDYNGIIFNYYNFDELSRDIKYSMYDKLYFLEEIHQKWRKINLKYSTHQFIQYIGSKLHLNNNEFTELSILAFISNKYEYIKFKNFLEENSITENIFIVLCDSIEHIDIDINAFVIKTSKFDSLCLPLLNLYTLLSSDLIFYYNPKYNYSNNVILDLVLHYNNTYADFYYKNISEPNLQFNRITSNNKNNILIAFRKKMLEKLNSIEYLNSIEDIFIFNQPDCISVILDPFNISLIDSYNNFI